MYAIVGLTLAYFTFRKGMPNLRAPTRPSGVPAPQQARAVGPNTKK